MGDVRWSMSAPRAIRLSISARIRNQIEKVFGWAKAVTILRAARHHGSPKVDWQFTLAVAG
jgi:hypothetical protein